MGQLERYGLFVLCLVIVLILGVAIWGGDPVTTPPSVTAPASSGAPVAMSELAPPAASDDVLRAPNELFEPVQPKALPKPTVTPLASPSARDDGTVSDADAKRSPPSSEPPDEPAPKSGGGAALRTYVVRKNDTFESIAKHELGSARFIDDIKKLNPHVDPRHMQIGSKLALPYDADADTAPKPDLGSNGWREYVVKDGDTPWDIAVAIYKNGKYAERILEANDIHDGVIHPRQVLHIPPLDD